MKELTLPELYKRKYDIKVKQLRRDLKVELRQAILKDRLLMQPKAVKEAILTFNVVREFYTSENIPQSLLRMILIIAMLKTATRKEINYFSFVLMNHRYRAYNELTELGYIVEEKTNHTYIVTATLKARNLLDKFTKYYNKNYNTVYDNFKG